MATINLNEHFGGGVPNLGNQAGAATLSDLNDVTLSSPVVGHALKFNGTSWSNSTISWLELSDTPTIPVNLDDLGNVSVAAPGTNQVLSYNGTDWIATTVATASQLDELTDVTVTATTDGFVLRANGTTWTSAQLDYADLANAPVVPVNGDFSVIGLSDTLGTAVASTFLKWNATGTLVEYAAITATDVSGLSTVATTGAIGDLTDVNVTGLTDGNILTYNLAGSEWVATTFTSTKLTDDDNDTFVSVNDTDDTINITAGPDGGNVIVTTGAVGSAFIVDDGAGLGVIRSNNLRLESNANSFRFHSDLGAVELSSTVQAMDITSNSTVSIQGEAWPTTAGTIGQVLTHLGGGLTEWATSIAAPVTSVAGKIGVVTLVKADITDFVEGDYATAAQGLLAGTALQGTDSIDALSDVDITTNAPANGEVLSWDGTNFVPAATSTITALNDLSDVTNTSPATGQVLRYNGTLYVNAVLDYNDLSNLPVAGTDFAAVTHIHPISDITSLQTSLDAKADRTTINNMLDVNTVSVASAPNQMLLWNDTTSLWERAPVSDILPDHKRIEDTLTTTFVDTESTVGVINITTPTGGGGIILTPSDSTVEVVSDMASVINSNVELSITTTAGDVTLAPTSTNLNVPANMIATAGLEVVSGANVTIDGQIIPNAVGTVGQVLTVLNATTGALEWATLPTGVTTFELLTDTPATYVGSAGLVATVNAGETGLEFSAPTAAAPVDSVFGRIGVVVGAASDYDASQIDNDSGVTGAFVSDALDQLDTDITAIDLTVKADKIIPALVGNIATLDAAGNLVDGGPTSAFATAAQGATADTATQPGDNLSTLTNDLGFITSVPVDSVFGRTGVVIGAASDYDASQIDNDSGVTGAFVSDALDQLNTDITAIDFSGKTDKIIPATVGNLAALDATGNLTDSGSIATDFATAAQGATADTATQPGDNNSTLTNDAGFITSTNSNATFVNDAGYITGISAHSIGDLADVDITGVTNGQALEWNTTNNRFEVVTPSAGVTTLLGLSDTPAAYAANANKILKVNSTPDAVEFGADVGDLENVDTTTVAPTIGDALQWDGTNWVPAFVETGDRHEFFRIDYNLDGTVTDVATNISEQSAGIDTITFTSTAANAIFTDTTFTGYDNPPAQVSYWGYAYNANTYVYKFPLTNGNNLRAGGTSGAPGVIFGSFSANGVLENKIDRQEVGASNGIGVPGNATHAYIVFKF